jgi:hypothetical protein
LRRGDFFDNCGELPKKLVASCDCTILALHDETLKKIKRYHNSTKGQRTEDPLRSFLPRSTLADRDNDGMLEGLDVLLHHAITNESLRPSFSPEITDYAVRVPSGQQHMVTVTPHLATRKKAARLTVPIVILCYGGGPLSMATLVANGDKPVIIVKGSGRAAGFIEEWCEFEAQKQIASPEQHRILELQQMQNAEETIRRDIAPTKRKAEEGGGSYATAVVMPNKATKGVAAVL